MELWIRTQDGERLTRCSDLRVYYAKQDDVWIIEDCDELGSYKTKERALKVLDEIQNKIRSKYIMQQTSGAIFDTHTIEEAKKYFERQNEISLISGDSNFDIVPINSEIVIYQMPKE